MVYLRAGGPGCTSLLPPAERVPPHSPYGVIDNALYACVDANLATPRSVSEACTATARSVSGIAIMLSRVCVDGGSQRQHLASADVHTTESNACGSCVHRVCVVSELMRELSVSNDAVPIYVDSESTLLCATSERSVKRSLWTIRRIIVMHEAVERKLADIIKIGEAHNLADLFTKYLKHKRWLEHITLLLNPSLPPRPPIQWRL